MSARTAAVTSGPEKTAGRSRLTSNRTFASGRRPGRLRPREASFSHTSVNHSSRHRCRPLVARPPTGASSCRSMTTGQSFRRRPTSCPRSTSTASDRRRIRGVEAPGTANWDTVCADARKTPPQADAPRFGEPPPDGRKAQFAAQGQSVSRKSVAEVPLTGLSFPRRLAISRQDSPEDGRGSGADHWPVMRAD